MESSTTGRRYAWYVVGMLWWVSFFNYADRQAIFSIFPLLEKEMHLTPVQLGLLGSSFAWVYGLAAPLAGGIVDRVRRKTAIVGGLFAWSVVCMSTALARNFRALFLVRSAQGLGETFYFPAAMSMISDYHAQQTRSRAMSVHQTSVYVGTIAGSFFAARIAESYGWKSSFIVFGGLGILLGLVLQRLLSEPERGADEVGKSSMAAGLRTEQVSFAVFLGALARTPTALMLMAAFLCANFVAAVLLSWMPKFLYDKFHFSLAMAGLSATLFAQLASMVGSPLGGWLADALRRVLPAGRVLVQGGAVLLGAPFVLLCAQTRSVKWLIVGLAGWGLFKGLYDANIFASLYDFIRPEARGTAAGMMNMVGWLGGGTAAPVLVGYVAERRSLTQALSLTALVYVAAGVLLVTAILVFASRDSARLRAQT